MSTSVIVARPEHEHDLTDLLPIPCGECPESEPTDEHPFGVTVRDATWQIPFGHERREFACDRCQPKVLREAWAAYDGVVPPLPVPLPVRVAHRALPGSVCATCGGAPGTCPVEGSRCVRQREVAA